MSYRDRTSKIGFFRNVPFFFEQVSGSIGRRTALKQFPGRDEPEVEDLGLDTREFTIDMFVIGENYDIARDNLRTVLEQAGPGLLNHPYWGALIVTVVGKVRVTETTKQGGMARFTVTFVEAGGLLSRTEVILPAASVLSAAESALQAVGDLFVSAFSVLNTISAVAELAVDTVNEATHQLNRVRGKIAAALQVIDDAAAAIDSFTSEVSSLIQTPIDFVHRVTDLYNTVVSSITKVTDAFDRVSEFFGSDGEAGVGSAGNILSDSTRVDLLGRAGADLGGFGDDFTDLPETTPAQARIAENRRQLVRLINVAVACEIAKASTDLTFDSIDQAQAVQDTVLATIDGVLNQDDLPDELYAPLADLRASVVEYLSGAASALPELDDYTPNASLPALVVAYQLYGDYTRESELLARNPQIKNPSAVPGGQAIKVLAND